MENNKLLTTNPNQFRDLIREELGNLCQRIKRNHYDAGQVASGATLRSIRFNVTDVSGSLHGEAYSLTNHFATLETGHAPSPAPKDFVWIIRKWMQDKGIKAQAKPYKRTPSQNWKPKYSPQMRGELSLAGAIAYNIVNHGTRLFRHGGRNDIYTKEIEGTRERIQEKIIDLFRVNIKTISKEG